MIIEQAYTDHYPCWYRENALVRKARLFAIAMHDGQERKTGGPYIAHPARVAARVAAEGGDHNMVAAAWLHDVVEDCDVPLDYITHLFGPTVSLLVGWLTDHFTPEAYPNRNRKIRKQLEADRYRMAPREVAIIKLADLADNTADIEKLDPGFVAVYKPEKDHLETILRARLDVT